MLCRTTTLTARLRSTENSSYLLRKGTQTPHKPNERIAEKVHNLFSFSGLEHLGF